MDMQAFKKLLRSHLTQDEMNECWLDAHEHRLVALHGYEVHVTDARLGRKIERAVMSHPDNAWSFYNGFKMKVSVAFCFEDNCNLVVAA